MGKYQADINQWWIYKWLRLWIVECLTNTVWRLMAARRKHLDSNLMKSWCSWRDSVVVLNSGKKVMYMQVISIKLLSFGIFFFSNIKMTHLWCGSLKLFLLMPPSVINSIYEICILNLFNSVHISQVSPQINCCHILNMKRIFNRTLMMLKKWEKQYGCNWLGNPHP